MVSKNYLQFSLTVIIVFRYRCRGIFLLHTHTSVFSSVILSLLLVLHTRVPVEILILQGQICWCQVTHDIHRNYKALQMFGLSERSNITTLLSFPSLFSCNVLMCMCPCVGFFLWSMITAANYTEKIFKNTHTLTQNTENSISTWLYCSEQDLLSIASKDTP